VPGAASFKRVLDGAHCQVLERAARQTEGWASSPWQVVSGQQRRQRTARRAPSVADLGWRGAANCSSPARLGARRPAHSPFKRRSCESKVAGWERAA